MLNSETYFLNELERNHSRALKTARSVSDYIHSTTAGQGEGTHRIHTLLIPKIYDPQAEADFKAIAERAYRIFSVIIHVYRHDSTIRGVFHFDPRMEELILTDCGYQCRLPMARFDIFYNEKTRDFSFCEINTDGTSAMNENKALVESLEHNDIYQGYAAELAQEGYSLHTYEYFDSWVKVFLELWQDFITGHSYRFGERRLGGFPQKPFVAIADIMEDAYTQDFVEFVKRFEAAGIESQIVDVRKMIYRNHRLYTPEGREINAVYRRATTADLLHHWGEVQPLIQAYREHAIMMAGGFATQLVHNKALFIALSNETLCQYLLRSGYLDEEDISFIQAHIPYTKGCTGRNLEQDDVLHTKDQWILKPLDSFGAQGIYLGMEHTQEEWADILNRVTDAHYLYQRYTLPYETQNISIDDSDAVDAQPMLSVNRYHNLTGLYMYGGNLAGIYTRVARGYLIGGQFGGRELPSVVARKM